MLCFYIYKYELRFNKVFIVNTQKHLTEHKGKTGRLKTWWEEITFSVLKYEPPNKNKSKMDS